MTDEAKTGVDKLVRVYLKMAAKDAELYAEYKEKRAKLKDQMALVKGELLDYCKEHDVESVRTSEGLFFRTVKSNYWTNDWDSFNKFVLEHEVPDLYAKRINQSNMKQFLEENPDLIPPGLNVDSEYAITVRRK
jgi:hypothetical protein